MKNLNKLYVIALSTVKADNGMFYTQEEFEKKKGKIWNITGYFYGVQNEKKLEL